MPNSCIVDTSRTVTRTVIHSTRRVTGFLKNRVAESATEKLISVTCAITAGSARLHSLAELAPSVESAGDCLGNSRGLIRPPFVGRIRSVSLPL